MEKYSLLIIDEDAYYAGIFASRFEAAGWHVRVAASIEEARTQLDKEIPAAMLIDPTSFEEMITFIHVLRKDSEASELVLMILTDLASRDQVRDAEAAGADGYFLKGHFFPSEAIEKLERLVDERVLN